MLYRCKLEETGGTWLKLAKTKSFVDKLLCNVGTVFIRSLRSSVVVFCTLDLEVPRSNPVRVDFFLFFFLMECLGPGARTGFQTPSPFYVLSSSCGIRTHTHNTKRVVRKLAVSGENSSQSVVLHSMAVHGNALKPMAVAVRWQSRH